MVKVGAYEVVRELGQGGVGRVLLARAPDGREVALKILLDRRPDALARFAREVRLAAGLGQGDGFVPVLEVGSSPELGPFVAFAYVPGGTLRERLARGPLTPGDALALGTKLATALGRAHALGIVHRDVKPENVLFTAEGEPLLADLGLAKHYDPGAPGASASAVLSRTGAFLGTAAYMPWEQAEDPRSVGPASDVFALGVLLYECLAGTVPFQGATVVEHLAAVEAGRFEPLRRACPGVSPAVAHAVESALARDPAARPEDGFAFARALTAAASAPRSRRGVAVVALLLGAGLVALGGAAAWLVGVRPRAPVAASPSPVAAGASPAASSPPASGARTSALVRARLAPFLDAKDWAALDREATLEIERGPGLAAAWSLRALSRSARSQMALAEADAARALALDPGDALAHYVLGDVKRLANDMEGAEREYVRSTELDPGSRAWLGLAVVRRVHGDVEGALAAAEKCVVLFPKNSSSWEQRAAARYYQGDDRGTIADATRAIELGTPNSLAWGYRGSSLMELGQAAAALPDLDRAVKLGPNDPMIWARRGMARRRLGDPRGAIEDLDAFFEQGGLKDSQAARYLSERGLAKGAVGDAPGARADVDEAVRREPRDVTVRAGRASFREEQRDLTGALEDLDEAVRLDPGRGPMWAARAAIQLALADAAGAEASATRAYEVDRRLVSILVTRAKARVRLGKRAEARADVETVLASTPAGTPVEVEARAVLATLDADAAPR